MIKNYLVITFRNLWKNKGYSFLNIFGLAIGIACAGFIFLWVEDEVSYDQFNVKKDRLYYVRENQSMKRILLPLVQHRACLLQSCKPKYQVSPILAG